jgi:TrmH family RNA methyltransferase
VLTSPKNPTVASAARLRKHAAREEAGRFLVEGAQAVSEALTAGRLDVLFTADDLDPIALRARQQEVETHLVADPVIRRLTSTVTPQPLVGVSPFVDVSLDDAMADVLDDNGGGCITLLHEVRDPGNAGTVLRSADAAGSAGVIFSETSVDVYNPKTVRASAGSVFHLPIVRGLDTAAVLERASAAGVRTLAMDADGTQDLYRTDLSGPVMFVFGNEAHGLPGDVAARADATVRVPQSGGAESLNLAAAATVCLFEWRRRRSRAAEAVESIIASAAHDIRSPLTAMKGFGYALERRWDAMSEEQRALMLQGIVHDADRMDTILRMLVDAARLVGGTLELFPEQVEVGALVEGVAESQRRDPDHPAVEWVGDVGPVFTDPARLRTILLAFCGSLVWWAQEGPIDVDGDSDGRSFELRASRLGAGLDADGVEELFTPRRPGEGAGSKIGLFVARGVAESQGGRCWGSVEAGRLTFHVQLPIDPARPPS